MAEPGCCRGLLLVYLLLVTACAGEGPPEAGSRQDEVTAATEPATTEAQQVPADEEPAPVPSEAVDAGTDVVPTPDAPEASTASDLPSFAQRVSFAAVVSVAVCVSASPRLEPQRDIVVTDVELQLERTLKGTPPASSFVSVTIPGGATADRATMSPHMASYAVGARYLLFLDATDGGVTLRQDNANSGLLLPDTIRYLGETLTHDEARTVLPAL